MSGEPWLRTAFRQQIPGVTLRAITGFANYPGRCA